MTMDRSVAAIGMDSAPGHSTHEDTMKSTDYAMKTRTGLSVAEAEAHVREQLAAEGFGVLTDIDIAGTLKTKLGVDRPEYKLLGACRPQFADRAIQAEPEVGLLLPCNVAVYDDGESTVVAALDPAIMIELSHDPTLAAIATEARDHLARVVASVPKG